MLLLNFCLKTPNPVKVPWYKSVAVVGLYAYRKPLKSNYIEGTSTRTPVSSVLIYGDQYSAYFDWQIAAGTVQSKPPSVLQLANDLEITTDGMVHGGINIMISMT